MRTIILLNLKRVTMYTKGSSYVMHGVVLHHMHKGYQLGFFITGHQVITCGPGGSKEKNRNVDTLLSLEDISR